MASSDDPRPTGVGRPAFSTFTYDVEIGSVAKATKSVVVVPQGPQTSNDLAWGSGATSGTSNTQPGAIQDTGLGPSLTDPGDAMASNPNSQASPFAEIGSSGLQQYGGFVRDEFLPQLQGDRGLRVYREMYDNDPIVGALVFTIQMLLRKVEWRVEPPESPTVEGIVASRQRERLQVVQQRQQEAQQQLLDAQAGIAGQGGSGASGMSPGGQAAHAAPPQPKPSFASPNPSTVTPAPFHKPLNANAAPGSSPVTPPSPALTPSITPSVTPSITPPSQPGANPPSPATSPGTNAPATPNSPLSNPGGGPNQHGALNGIDGLPGAQAATDPRRAPFTKAVAGQFVGGIGAQDVGSVPIDPETGEPMEFPIGTGPNDPPSPEEQHAMELAVFVETAIHDMADSWSDTISQITTMIVYGFAFHELVYKKRNGPNPDQPVQGSRFADGRIGWAKIAGRAQETRHRWEFDESGNVLGMWQLAPPKMQLKYIPMSKALLFRTTGYKQNPEGRSILRSAYRPWYLKRRIEEIEAIGCERNLAGIPVAYVPYQWLTENATPGEKQALEEVKRIVRNVRIDDQNGLVFPTIIDPDTKTPLFKFELMSSSSTSKVNDTDKMITRYDQRIAMVALVDFILLGHESVGAKALAETKTDLFTTALESWLNVIADVFNTSAIPRLMQINGEDPAMSPRLTFGNLARVGLTDVAALITALAAAGADLFPDTQLEDYVRNAAGLPAKQSTDDL